MTEQQKEEPFGKGVRKLATPVHAVRKTSAAVIYDALYKSIARMELLPGQALSEKELIEQFGVSRTPIREALLHLEGDGLVDLIPQAGTFVAKIPIIAIREAIVLRRALEDVAISRVTQFADDRDIARLDVTLAQQRLSAALGDAAGFHDADEAFHEAIANAAGFTTLWPMVRQMKIHLDRLRVLSLPIQGRMSTTADEHQRIRDAISQNDTAAARQAMHDHLGVMLPYIDELSREHPDYFSGSVEGVRSLLLSVD